MSLIQQLDLAFGHRLRPRKVIDPRDRVDSDEVDALWFASRDWRDLTWEDWENHSGALYAFTPEAFAYYLPSILLLSSECREKWFGPADTLLGILNRSPVVEYWDTFLTTRLLGLESAEYQAVKDWLLSLSNATSVLDEDDLTRAYETVDLLERETAKLRGV